MSKQFALAEVKELATDDPNGAFEVILSAPTLDRDDEVIDARAFEPLPDHITFDIDHGMSTATTVGSGVPSYLPDGRLHVRGSYSSIARAQEVRTLVNEGHIRTTSVAFMNAKRERGEDGKMHIRSAELLNGAFVPIPSNREALVLSSKAHREAAAVLTTSVAAKALGQSVNNLRTMLNDALELAYAGWPWVRDFSDAWVVFEVWDGEHGRLYQQDYALTGNVATLTGVPVEVVALITYEAISTDSTDAPAPPAKSAGQPSVAPADEAGKAPASEVVGKHRLLVDARLLTL